MDTTTVEEFILKTAIKSVIYLVSFCVGYSIADTLGSLFNLR